MFQLRLIRSLIILLTVISFTPFIQGGCGGGGGGGGGGSVDTTGLPDNTITVTGKILDSRGDPIPSAQVTITSNPVTATTGSDGTFSANVEAGDHTLTANKGSAILCNIPFSTDEESSLNLGEIKTTIPYYASKETWFKDTDGDQYSDGTKLIQETQPTGYFLRRDLSSTSGDCNDGDTNIHSGVKEVCGDSIDQDCSGADLICSLQIGDTASHADWDYKVTDVTVMTSIGQEVPRGTYVAALVQLTNKGTTDRSIGSQFFVVQDDQDRIYEMDTDASLEYHLSFETDYWYLDEIAPSGTATIPIVFDVSPDSAQAILLPAGINEPAILLVDNLGEELLALPGQTFVSGDWSFLVSDVSTASTIGDEVARGEYVTVIITARNDGLTTRKIGSDLFYITDSQGRSYEMNTDASLAYYSEFETDAWHLEDLGPSFIGTVPIVFDVAVGASGFVLVTQENAQISLP